MADDAATRMSRATRALGETYTLLLLLTWNDIVTNGGKQSVHQIEQSIKVRAIDWVRELFESYTYIPIKDASSASLTSQIEKDTGVQSANLMVPILAGIDHLAEKYDGKTTVE